MDKKQELQSYLSNEQYVTRSDIAKMCGITYSGVNAFLAKHKIAPVARFCLGFGKRFVFYDVNHILSARNGIANSNERLQLVMSDHKYVEARDLAIEWNQSPNVVRYFLAAHNIYPVEAVLTGRPSGRHFFYDRAACDAAKQEEMRVNSLVCSEHYITMTELCRLYGKKKRVIRSIFARMGVSPVAHTRRGIAIYERQKCLDAWARRLSVRKEKRDKGRK